MEGEWEVCGRGEAVRESVRDVGWKESGIVV